MRLFKLIPLIALTLLVFSCTNENTIEQEIKTLTLEYKDQKFEINYLVTDGTIELAEGLNEELKALQENNDLWLHVDQNNNLVLSSKKTAATPVSQRTGKGYGLEIDEQKSFFSNFGLSKINHYGYVSDNLTAQMQSFADSYYVSGWYKPKLKSYQYFEQGKAVDYTVDLIFTFTGGDQIEPIQADPTQNNIFGNAAKNNPGFHHYGFSVKNLEEATKKFTDAGYQTACSAIFETNGGLVSKLTFIDTRNQVNAYTELVEAKLLGFNVEQNEGLLILGLFLGDVSLVHL